MDANCMHWFDCIWRVRSHLLLWLDDNLLINGRLFFFLPSSLLLLSFFLFLSLLLSFQISVISSARPVPELLFVQQVDIVRLQQRGAKGGDLQQIEEVQRVRVRDVGQILRSVPVLQVGEIIEEGGILEVLGLGQNCETAAAAQ